MKKFMADWKNPALLAAAVLIVFLLVLVFVYGSQSINKSIVTIGDVRITRKDVLAELRRQDGDKMLLKMIDDTLLADYARQKDITVSDAEVEQILKRDRLAAAAGGMTLDEAMAKRGMTVAELRHEYTLGLLSMKLTIPKEEIAAAYADLAKKKTLNQYPYTLPACYRYRRFIAPGEKEAKEIAAILQKSDTPESKRITDATGKSMDSTSAKLLYYVAGTQARDYPVLLSQLPNLQPGQVSTPVQIAVQQLGIKAWAIVQLDSVTPVQPPTLENCGVQIGFSLMRGDKYEQRLQMVKMDAFQKIEVNFNSDDFKEAYDTIQQEQRQSIAIPGPQGTALPGPQGTALPGAGPTNGAAGPQPAGPRPSGPQPPASGGR